MKKTLMILLGLGAFLPAATAQSGPPAAAAPAFRLEAEQALHGPDTLEIRIYAQLLDENAPEICLSHCDFNLDVNAEAVVPAHGRILSPAFPTRLLRTDSSRLDLAPRRYAFGPTYVCLHTSPGRRAGQHLHQHIAITAERTLLETLRVPIRNRHAASTLQWRTHTMALMECNHTRRNWLPQAQLVVLDPRLDLAQPPRLQRAAPAPAQVFPNPTQGEVNIRLGEEWRRDGQATLRLVTLEGQEALRQRFAASAGAHTLPLAGLPAGTYVLHIETRARARAFALTVQP